MSRQEQFFHGTNRPLETVLPATAAGIASTPSSSHQNMKDRRGTSYDPHEHAHVSERENSGWFFAGRAADGAGGGRSRVLTTGPAPDMRMGLEHRRNRDRRAAMPSNAEWISKTGFPVTGSIDTMPPETVRRRGSKHMRYDPNPDGRQGTLPLDWRPHIDNGRDRNGTRYGVGDLPANHPTGKMQQAERDLATEQQEVREGKRGRRTAGKWGITKPGPVLKHPPMYMAGLKVDDSISEKLQGAQFGGQKQPMLPGMRGMKKP